MSDKFRILKKSQFGGFRELVPSTGPEESMYIPGPPGAPGKPGEPGKTPTPAELVALMRPMLEEARAAIRAELLAELRQEDALEPTAIKGLSDFAKRIEDRLGTYAREFYAAGGQVLSIFSSGSRVTQNFQELNFTGSGVTTSYAGSGRVTVSISGGGGGFTTLPPTETPNGTLKVFTFSAATAQPSFIISDNVMMQATTKAGTANWTWNNAAKQATMTIAPTDDIIGVV